MTAEDRKCWLCKKGVSAADASRDHADPRSEGGFDKSKNYRLAHRACNSARGNLPYDLTRRVLSRLRPGLSTQAVCQELHKADMAWNRAYGPDDDKRLATAAVLRLQGGTIE